MKPKEKAKQLVTNFILKYDNNSHAYIIDEKQGKRFALIAVDEILNDSFYTTTINLSGIYYWKQVKQEIENL